MTLSADDLYLIRNYVPWDPPTDDDLAARWLVLGSWQAVAREQVQRRLSQMINNPSSFSVGGEYSESWSANIEALRKAADELAEMIPAGSEGSTGFGSATLVREGRSGRYR